MAGSRHGGGEYVGVTIVENKKRTQFSNRIGVAQLGGMVRAIIFIETNRSYVRIALLISQTKGTLCAF